MAAELVYFEGCIFKKLNYEKCKREKHIYNWEMEDEPLLIKLYYMLFYTIENLDQNHLWSLYLIENTVLGLQYVFQIFIGIVLKATDCRAFTTSLERLSTASYIFHFGVPLLRLDILRVEVSFLLFLIKLWVSH